MNLKVSIIVPIYGVERYIERCAVSLFEQTYPNIEYVFVNDATKDRSIEILEEVITRYPARQKDVRIITHPKNMGISATRNTGLRAITGDYVFYVDSDDYLAVDAMEKLVGMAEQNEADVVIFDVNVVTEKGIYRETVQYTNKVDYIHRLLQHTEKCAHWNKFYNAKFYLSTEIFADERVRLADDYAVTPRIIYEAQRIVMYHEPLYFYETMNLSSYVHNLKRTAIESQYMADQILVEYFTHISDASLYEDVISVLPQRSMVSLIKNTDAEVWNEILDVYMNELSYSGRQMTVLNRIIFYLAKNRRMKLLKMFMIFYHLEMGDRR